MNGASEASVVVAFDSTEDRLSTLLWEQDQGRTTVLPNQTYLRLYSMYPVVRTATTSGVLNRVGSHAEPLDSYVTFSGSREVALPYPEINNLVCERQGSFFGVDGRGTQISLTVDMESQRILASHPCYGKVRIRGSVPYVLYLYTFHGAPCAATTRQDGTVEYISGYKPALVLAVDSADSVATYDLSPPSCDTAATEPRRTSEARPPSFKLEIHKDYKPALRAPIPGNTGILRAYCGVRIIPDVDAEVSTTAGTVEPFEGLDNTEVVKEALVFGGSASVNLGYQPWRGLEVTGIGGFINRWGNAVSISFALPGESYKAVDWVSEGRFSNIRNRTVGPDELVAVDHGGRALEVYGAVSAKYDIRYKTYRVNFAENARTGSVHAGWKTSYMVAALGNVVASIQLQPPSLKET